MRGLLRILFVLMFFSGVLLAIVYPWLASSSGGYEIGRYVVHDGSEWRPAEAALSPAQAPVYVTVMLHAAEEFRSAPNRAVLTLAARLGDRIVHEQNLTFPDPPSKKSPQAREATYRDDAGVLETVEMGAYVFAVAPADAAGVDIESVELLLHSGSLDLDSRAQPAGFILMALGFIGFVLAFRRFTGRGPRNPNEKPPSRKWGRG